MPTCYGCGASDSGFCIVALDGDLHEEERTFVYAETSRGNIGFCNVCFDARQFRDLSNEDIEILNWFFGSANVETNPAKAIALLEPIVAQWWTPDSLSPLGRAYISAGRHKEGRALLSEALSRFPNHPYVRRDREALAATEAKSE